MVADENADVRPAEAPVERADAPPADAAAATDPDADATPCTYTEYRSGEAEAELPATGEDATGIEADVWAALYGVEDPEMPISVVDLGLIYGVAVEGGAATVEMTLTYSGCPARDMLTDDVDRAVAAVDGIESVDVQFVWSPEWTVDMVTDRGEEALREFGLSV